ncbi:hypothetical protein [Streptomyces sp. NPDC049915]|uniref:DUF6895 family protein n=1 Tax=Streptomyces sp. NPDC049915 TaxID=3155510 RepID=UPI0034165120
MSGAGTEPARDVLPRVVGWLERNLRFFDPETWERHLPRRPFRAGPLLELLGFLRLLSGTPAPTPTPTPAPVRPVPEGLRAGALALAEQVVGTAEFTRRLRRADEFFPYHLNLVALQHLLGRPRPALLHRCEALLVAGAGGHFQPHRPLLSRLELRYVADRAGVAVPPGVPGLPALYRQSVPGLGADPLALDDTEIYAFTHALFYATDFGAHALPPGAAVDDTVRVLLASHLIGGHLDLLAELLLCADVVGLEETGLVRGGRTDLVRRGWTALASAQRPDGAVPGPVHRPAVLSGLTGEKAEAYLFGTCYHTTLATGLAAAARLRQVSRPVPEAPSPCLPESAAEGTPSPYPPVGAAPDAVHAWAGAVAAAAAHAAEPDRARWAEAVTGALVLCARRRDRPGLEAVLRAAGVLGVAESPLVRSATARLAAGWCG